MIQEANNYKFPKEEKLCSQKSIDELFKDGKSFIAYPLRAVYTVAEMQEGEPAIKLLISVSKRKFKRAVKRNRVKRLIREAFRLNKKELENFLCTEQKQLTLALLFLKDELPSFEEIEKAFLKTIVKLKENLSDVEKTID